ncbi:MAG: large subunit ribosomal protein [Desulfonauticus sp.]|jgi:large subunit ribosomal protein L18|nr:large subunit ribosomal protein [Desulfonauticus sp.]
MRKTRQEARLKRKIRIRKKIRGTSERPRLVVFRSNRYIYAQVIDDLAGKTLVSYSSLVMGKKNVTKEVAKEVGKKVAELAKGKNIEQVVFDRNGYLYHGRVKALADGAREGGLKF